MTGLHEAARMLAGLSDGELELWVHAGWILPDAAQDGVRFSAADLARARLIRELRYDLAIDTETVPMILSLVDQIHGLRRELRRLTQAVAAQPDSVRKAITEARGGL